MERNDLHSVGAVVDTFRQAFAELGPESEMPMESIYGPQITLVDPFHRIEGLEAVRTYFSRQNARLKVCRFEFRDCELGADQAWLSWVSHIELKRQRRAVTLEGCSHLLIRDGRIVFHRDYFDGSLIFEQIPLMGCLLRALRRLV